MEDKKGWVGGTKGIDELLAGGRPAAIDICHRLEAAKRWQFDYHAG